MGTPHRLFTRVIMVFISPRFDSRVKTYCSVLEPLCHVDRACESMFSPLYERDTLATFVGFEVVPFTADLILLRLVVAVNSDQFLVIGQLSLQPLDQRTSKRVQSPRLSLCSRAVKMPTDE